MFAGFFCSLRVKLQELQRSHNTGKAYSAFPGGVAESPGDSVRSQVPLGTCPAEVPAVGFIAGLVWEP